MTEQKYRLTQYNPGAWCIEELVTVPEINEKTGKANKHPGSSWKIIKYPGNLEQACTRLLSLVIGTDAYSSVDELKNAVRVAQHEISANVAAYVRLHSIDRAD